MTARRHHAWTSLATLLAAAVFLADGALAEDAAETESPTASARRSGEVRGDRDEPGRRGGTPGGRRQPSLDNLAETMSPEEFAELRRLQREDPAAFRRKVHEGIRQFRQQRNEDYQRLRTLQQAYHEATDDAARELARAALAQAVTAEFAEQMEGNRQRLEQSRARLAEVERKFSERQANAEQTVANRIRELTEGPILPEAPPGHPGRRRSDDDTPPGGSGPVGP
jgi:hypothetical protein